MTSTPLCVFFLSPLQVHSRFDFVKCSLFFHPFSIGLLPLTFLVPPGLLLFSLHSPSRDTQLSCYPDPPPPPALTADQIYADEYVTTCCEGGGLCVCTCMWEGLRKWFGFEGWAGLKIVAAHSSACACMCWYLVLEKKQPNQGSSTCHSNSSCVVKQQTAFTALPSNSMLVKHNGALCAHVLYLNS